MPSGGIWFNCHQFLVYKCGMMIMRAMNPSWMSQGSDLFKWEEKVLNVLLELSCEFSNEIISAERSVKVTDNSIFISDAFTVKTCNILKVEKNHATIRALLFCFFYSVIYACLNCCQSKFFMYIFGISSVDPLLQ